LPLESGAPAPLFTLNDAKVGQPYRLAEALQRGPVLFGIYKSSCEASKTAFPFLEKIGQAYPELIVWGIAQDSPNVTRSFIRRTGVTFPMLIDDDDYAVSRAYDIVATPTLLLIDRSGAIVWQRMGFQKASIVELSARIAELLGVVPIDVLAGSDQVPAWVPG
jgi:peroxiredoxin